MKIFLAHLLILVFLPSVALGSGFVRRIIIFGHEKTERKAILKIIDVKKKEFVDKARLKKIRENLLNCGLFRKVRVRTRKVGRYRIDIIVRVTEKTSVFLFPIVRAWSGRYSGGLIFGESNLFGENKKTLLVGEGGNKLNQFFGAYEDTALFNSDYTLRLATIVRSDKVPLYTGYEKRDEATIKDVGVVIMPGYKWTDRIVTRIAIDIRYLWFGNSPVVPITDENGLSLSMKFEFIYDSMRRYQALVKGGMLKFGFEFADSRMGSDFEYNKQQLEIRYATQLFRYFNWLLDFQAALGRDLPFHEEYTLGGVSLRGYNDRQFRGDTFLRLANELTFPIYSHKLFGLRGVVFFDTGLVYFDSQGIDKNDFNNGTGGGLRVYMKRVVMPVLGLDFAYGIDNGNFGVYFSVGLMEF